MSKTIMIGCDVHDATLVLKIADSPGPSLRKAFRTEDRAQLIAGLHSYAAQRGATRIVLA